MSTIGTGGPGFLPIVGSAAGAAGQQRVATTNQQHAEAAERKFAIDQQAQTDKALGDVAESEQSDERDADGRQPWSFSRRRPPAQPGAHTEPHAVDPDHERGATLDLEA